MYMGVNLSKAIHISLRPAADNLSLYFDVKDKCSVLLRRPLDKCVVPHQNKMGYLVIHLIISLKSNILRNTQKIISYKMFLFSSIFLLKPVKIIAMVHYIDIIFFLTVADAVSEEVPDFYGGKTDSKTIIISFLFQKL